MENLADILKPQVPSNERKDQEIDGKIKIIDPFVFWRNLRFLNICQICYTGLTGGEAKYLAGGDMPEYFDSNSGYIFTTD